MDDAPPGPGNALQQDALMNYSKRSGNPGSEQHLPKIDGYFALSNGYNSASPGQRFFAFIKISCTAIASGADGRIRFPGEVNSQRT